MNKINCLLVQQNEVSLDYISVAFIRVETIEISALVVEIEIFQMPFVLI